MRFVLLDAIRIHPDASCLFVSAARDRSSRPSLSPDRSLFFPSFQAQLLPPPKSWHPRRGDSASKYSKFRARYGDRGFEARRNICARRKLRSTRARDISGFIRGPRNPRSAQFIRGHHILPHPQQTQRNTAPVVYFAPLRDYSLVRRFRTLLVPGGKSCFAFGGILLWNAIFCAFGDFLKKNGSTFCAGLFRLSFACV